MKKVRRFPLDTVCEVEYGTRVVQKRDGGNVFPVYGGGGATFKMDTFNREDRLVVARFGMSEQCTRFVEGKFFLNDSGLTVSAKPSLLDQRFLDYHLLALNDEIYALGKGTAQKNLDVPLFRSLGLFVPESLPEQQRIVALLDEAFAGLATAQAHAERNLRNARALFESHLNAVFTQRGEGWVETTLGKAYDVRDGTHDSPKYHATGHPLITSKNLKPHGLSFDDVKLINEKDYAKINERSAVHKGDVLFAMIGTIGNPTLVEVEPSFAIKNVALFKNANRQSGAFLKHYLDSGIVSSKMKREAKGTTQKFVGLGYLRDFSISLPPLAAQLKLVDKLDALSTETQRLTRLYEQKLAALAALKRSLLHQAFSGEL